MTIYLKKKYVLLLFSIVLLGCSEQISKNSLNEQELSPSLTIEYAKDWYKTNLQSSKESNLLKVRNSDSTFLQLKPLLNWNGAELDNDSIWSVVELPWEFEDGKVNMATQEVYQYCENNQSKKESILRLVILKNRKTGRIYGFKMAVVPDLEYMLYMLSKSNKLLSTNYYLNRDTKLSGLVLFYSVSDQFVNGWQYKDGKVVGKLNETVAKTKASSNSQKIAALYQVIEVQTCVDYRVESAGAATAYGTDCSSSVFTIDSSGGSGGTSSTPSGGYNTNYGGGGTNQTNQLISPKNTPCVNLSIMGNNIKFKDAITKLYDSTKGNFEILSTLYINKPNDNYSFDFYNGIPNSDGASAEIVGPLDAQLHSHYQGLSPIYSYSDLKDLYKRYTDGTMRDVSTFQYILVTQDGIYSLTISDLEKFKQFGQKYLNTNIININRDGLIADIKNNSFSPSTQAIDKFVQILNTSNSGLSLTTSDIYLNTIQNKTVDQNNNVTTSNCTQIIKETLL